jgi:hypothetical protein
VQDSGRLLGQVYGYPIVEYLNLALICVSQRNEARQSLPDGEIDAIVKSLLGNVIWYLDTSVSRIEIAKTSERGVLRR